MSFLNRNIVTGEAVFVSILTPKALVSAKIRFNGYQMALIDSARRATYAIKLIAASKALGIPPSPVWQAVLDQPDVFDRWQTQILSGAYDDQLVANMDNDIMAEVGLI